MTGLLINTGTAASDIEQRNTIVVLNRAGEQQLELTKPPPGFNQNGTYQGTWQLFDSWSPDSEQFLYDQLVITDASSPGTPSLRLHDVATGEDREVAPVGRYGSWSRDGSRVAYFTAATGERSCGIGELACIVVIDVVSGSELYRGPLASDSHALESSLHDLTLPAFLNDGRVVYQSFLGTELRIAGPRSSEVLLVANPLRWFAVSPDDRYVITAEAGNSGRLLLVPIPAAP